MRQISSSELRKDLFSILDTAQQEPIIIKKEDQDYAVIISMKDYEDFVKTRNLRLKQLAKEIGQEAQKNGLTPEILQDILDSDS